LVFSGVLDTLSTQADPSSSEEVKQPVAEGTTATEDAVVPATAADDAVAVGTAGVLSPPDSSICYVDEAAITASCQPASRRQQEQQQQQQEQQKQQQQEQQQEQQQQQQQEQQQQQQQQAMENNVDAGG
jgi:flagellar biosynthesis component FlhA